MFTLANVIKFIIDVATTCLIIICAKDFVDALMDLLEGRNDEDDNGDKS